MMSRPISKSSSRRPAGRDGLSPSGWGSWHCSFLEKSSRHTFTYPVQSRPPTPAWKLKFWNTSAIVLWLEHKGTTSLLFAVFLQAYAITGFSSWAWQGTQLSTKLTPGAPPFDRVDAPRWGISGWSGPVPTLWSFSGVWPGSFVLGGLQTCLITFHLQPMQGVMSLGCGLEVGSGEYDLALPPRVCED